MSVWAIIGSCDFPDEERVKKIIRDFIKTDDIIVIGGSEGPETWAKEISNELGCKCNELFASWEEHGRQAGRIRNNQTVKSCDRVLAFWDGEDQENLDMIKKATTAGLMVIIFGPREEEDEE